jgi:hypothetical protein
MLQQSCLLHACPSSSIQYFINMAYDTAFSKDKKRFLGVLYPDASDDIRKVYTIKCQMISFEDAQQISTVEVTYSLKDFEFHNGQTTQDIPNWKESIKPLWAPCLFDARCERLDENKYKVTRIRYVC